MQGTSELLTSSRSVPIQCFRHATGGHSSSRSGGGGSAGLAGAPTQLKQPPQMAGSALPAAAAVVVLACAAAAGLRYSAAHLAAMPRSQLLADEWMEDSAAGDQSRMRILQSTPEVRAGTPLHPTSAGSSRLRALLLCAHRGSSSTQGNERSQAVRPAAACCLSR